MERVVIEMAVRDIRGRSLGKVLGVRSDCFQVSAPTGERWHLTPGSIFSVTIPDGVSLVCDFDQVWRYACPIHR
jgi:hypothetical protein